MKASETRFQPLIEGAKQYVVPLFQRPYSWERRQWQTLWTDIRDLENDEHGKGHFMGAIVTMPAHTVPEGVTKYLLIDGQQRLTTLFVLLIALRDMAKSFPGNLADKVQELFLTNKYQEELDIFKMLPTQADRESFLSLVDSEQAQPSGKIGQSYQYFAGQLAKMDKSQLEQVLNTVTSKLFFVSIVLSADDNAYLIFESLNFKGMPLTQADLIRNYFLMRIHVKKQESVFTKYWQPMQAALGVHFTDFIRHFLTMKNQQPVKKDEVYFTLKTTADSFDQDKILTYLGDFNKFASFYERFVTPNKEPSRTIRERLHALQRIEVTTAYPFLMELYAAYSSGEISESYVVAVLTMIESYLIRRYICGVPTHGLNRFFPTLFSYAMSRESFVDGVREALGRNCPNDATFLRSFETRQMYGTGERLAKARYILLRLEGSFGHKESVETSTLQIEHIMPQKLTDWWQSHLGEKWESVHKQFVDTIGNLTLTGFNQDMSNSSFDAKKDFYRNSHLELSKPLALADRWTQFEMSQRGSKLAQTALKIWAYLGQDDNMQIEEVEAKPKANPDPALTYAELLTLLGGGTRKGSSSAYALKDGKAIIATVSKYHVRGRYYWYGISPSKLKLVESESCSHVAFGMGMNAVALIPAKVVQDLVPDCRVSKYKDGSIHHYHFTISSGPTPELYGGGDGPRVSVKDFVVRSPERGS